LYAAEITAILLVGGREEDRSDARERAAGPEPTIAIVCVKGGELDLLVLIVEEVGEACRVVFLVNRGIVVSVNVDTVVRLARSNNESIEE